ncbi:MAG: Holliday junction resolvase RecU [Selenomonas sp.]|nr:Holliday junction resolvase RecU [Selenomonas sp.]
MNLDEEIEKEKRRYAGAVNRSQGLLHEKLIEAGCQYYRIHNKAYIVKEPEPFRVISKDRRSKRAVIQFVKHAQPDFHGTLAGGRSIVFEAKYTHTDKLKQDVVTPEQADSLNYQQSLGAAAFVCVGLNNKAYMVPWPIFSNMKNHFGRKYATEQDLQPYEVKIDMAIKFLDYKKVNPCKAKNYCKK